MLFFIFLLLVLLVLFLSIGTLMFKLLYTLCIGFPIALCLCICGILLCITIIGIPVGLLLFKAAGFVLVPYRS